VHTDATTPGSVIPVIAWRARDRELHWGVQRAGQDHTSAIFNRRPLKGRARLSAFRRGVGGVDIGLEERVEFY
jgi:hypothetical protein